MGIIKVQTPQGVVQVQIEGDEPTEQELQDIDDQFSHNKQLLLKV